MYIKKTTPQGFITTSPLPTKEELQNYYRDKYYQAPKNITYQTEYPQIELEYKKLRCDMLVTAIQQNGIKKGKFLDIGTGEGFLLQSAFDFNFEVTGIDYSSFGVEKFHPNFSNNLISGDIFEELNKLVDAGDLFNVISSVNVLEHVLDPFDFLLIIKRILKPEGILSITVPNDFSTIQDLLMKRGMIDREFWFVPPEHIQYFNNKNLITFCESMGYKVIDSFSDFPIDLFLLHPESNYVMERSKGSSAHTSRMEVDLLMAQSGMEKYLNLYRALFQVGLGRNITVLLKVKD